MGTRCLKCGHEAPGAPVECPACGAIYAKVQALVEAGRMVRSIPKPMSPEERAQAEHQAAELAAARTLAARKAGQWSQVEPAVYRQCLERVVVVTTESVPGREIEYALGMVAGDYAFAWGAIYEDIAGLARNVIGSGKSGRTVSAVEDARIEVVKKLRERTLDVGGNCVIGVRIDYEEFSGANQRGILTLMATGTAVWLRE